MSTARVDSRERKSSLTKWLLGLEVIGLACVFPALYLFRFLDAAGPISSTRQLAVMACIASGSVTFIALADLANAIYTRSTLSLALVSAGLGVVLAVLVVVVITPFATASIR